MKLSIPIKLLLASIVAVLGSFLAATFLFSGQIESEVSREVREDMIARARLGAQLAAVANAQSMQDLGVWQKVATELAARAETRVTVVRADGAVIGDSEVGLDQLRVIENHGSRPEIKAALETGVGSAARRSKTLDVDEIYVAVAFDWRGQRGVLRVAQPLRNVVAAIDRNRQALATAGLLAVVCMAIASFFAASSVATGVRKVTDTVRRIANGELAARTGATATDEVGELGRAVDDLASRFGVTLQQLQSQVLAMQGQRAGTGAYPSVTPPRS